LSLLRSNSHYGLIGAYRRLRRGTKPNITTSIQVQPVGFAAVLPNHVAMHKFEPNRGNGSTAVCRLDKRERIRHYGALCARCAGAYRTYGNPAKILLLLSQSMAGLTTTCPTADWITRIRCIRTFPRL